MAKLTILSRLPLPRLYLCLFLSQPLSLSLSLSRPLFLSHRGWVWLSYNRWRLELVDGHALAQEIPVTVEDLRLVATLLDVQQWRRVSHGESQHFRAFFR